MGSIKDKASYLLDTKNAIKLSMRLAGANIDDSTPFRQYADKLTDFVGTMEDESGNAVMQMLDLVEGNIYSAEDYAAAYIKIQKFARLCLGVVEEEPVNG